MITFLLATVVLGCSAQPTASQGPTNLVVLSIDTLRPDHLGLYGYDKPTSPNMDKLAARSVVFEQAVTVHVTTAPAHATILTGLEPLRHGILRNGMRLSRDVPTLAESLAAAGWATGAFVSGWTLQRHTGLDRGFEIYDDSLDAPGAGARRDGGFTTNRALGWIDNQVVQHRPFFLFLHLFEPHWPYEPQIADAERFLPFQYVMSTWDKPVHLDRLITVNRLTAAEQREYVARYDGEIVAADRLVDRLLDDLKTLGVADNTVVILLSDHGETLFERPWTMDHGARPYDEQARVPLILSFPDGQPARRVADQVSLLDIAPTVFDILDVEPPEGLRGRSLVPLARGETDARPRPAVITARPEPERVPHISAGLSGNGLVRAIRLPKVKLIEYPTTERGWHQELFDLTADPGETVDLSGERKTTVDSLDTELQRLWSTTDAAVADTVELDPEVEKALKELGYIDDDD